MTGVGDFASPAPDSDIDPDLMRAFEDAARKLVTEKPKSRKRATKTRRGKGS